MKEFKNDKEKLDFLIPIVSRYRIFLMKFLDVTRLQFIGIISRRLNVSEEQCHLKSLSLGDCIIMIQELKKFKYELTGSKRLPEKVNPRTYALKVKARLKEE